MPTESSDIDHLFEMAVTAKPYLRQTLERMRASIETMENPSARQGFADFLRKVLVADHSDVLSLIDGKPEENP